MDLKSGYPFWAVKNGLLKTFPQLTRDHQSEVVVIGGGITGALIADELSRHGHHVVVLERRDARVEEKAEGLARKVEELLPKLDINLTFSWGGTFAETDDGLPFFGPHEEHGPRVQFAMAYGGNGISYSMIGAKLLRELIEGREHPLAALFSFQRLKL
ncbi:FAD-dependent oxidoreductase [Vreelandella nigrificans]|uniref:FAD dependent oxidoreductase domain-containing protein n=1 Tax=Vreelandella nigrificans TaxID=2042704 RepID=A0A2A4HH78_9GAMM|nr:FAD-dependent oxidoreductase [Halomonas nigrificans]PCF94272.1 hypothetical protein CPA45_17975 [Halomonas nigrificans]